MVVRNGAVLMSVGDVIASTSVAALPEFEVEEKHRSLSINDGGKGMSEGEAKIKRGAFAGPTATRQGQLNCLHAYKNCWTRLNRIYGLE